MTMRRWSSRLSGTTLVGQDGEGTRTAGEGTGPGAPLCVWSLLGRVALGLSAPAYTPAVRRLSHLLLLA